MPVHGDRDLREAHDVAEDMRQEGRNYAAGLKKEIGGVPAEEAGVPELESYGSSIS